MIWESFGPIMSAWNEKANQIKDQGAKNCNPGQKAFGKILANAAYGQSLKQDRNEVVKIVSTWEEADRFVRENKLLDIFECGEYDVIKGQRNVSHEQFISSRCGFLGSFILGYTRGMVFEIIEAACPNRYNELGVHE